MLTEERRAAFHDDVAKLNLRSTGSKSDRPLRIAGAVLMVVGVVGAFVAYNGSLAQSDSRDLASSQILAIACLAVTVAGLGLFVVGALARVLRLWLLRQLHEGAAQAEALRSALDRRV